MSFQPRVVRWVFECFGHTAATDKTERIHRFTEEALELAQACGASAKDCHQLVDYVYGRPIDPPEREVGGVMLTLAALCYSHGLSMDLCGEAELKRAKGNIDKIRQKQAAKPAIGPLPGPG